MLTPACRPLPDPVPWATAAAHGQQVQLVSMQLADLTREVAAAWQGNAVAVVDSGHHSCLAAAIRLRAVYRLSNVVLLQLIEDH